ncbi:hypothetical protein G9A89_020736 [Geosiphon pyriformis]|nr:hypothetical protein G9A89_020736 [Geosiphon pyriformis]
MTMTKTKSKKAAPDICSKISNKISTREAFSVVEATKQNVLEVFPLPSNHDKLSLVVTETTSSSLAGFLLVKVSLKKHTWIGLNQPLAVLPNVVFSNKSSPVLETKQSSSIGSSVFENWTDQIETESSSPLVSGTTSGGAWKTIASHQRFAGWVVSTLVSDTTFKIKLAHVKTVFQSVHGFLDVKSVLKDNIKLFCVKFASQVSLKAVILVKLTSSVYLATLKIAKSLVVSEFGSSSTAVALHNVSLNVSAADIKTALSVFGVITHVVLKPADIWQYVIVHFENLVAVISALSYWSVLVAPPPPSKTPKMFKPYFVGSLSYAKAFVPSVFSGFFSLVAAVFPVAVVNSLVFSQLVFLESNLAKLSVLVESIVKSVGSMVKVFEQFVNDNLVSSSALGLRVNKVLVYMSTFSKAVDKLE